MGRGANCASRAKLSNLASMWSSPEEHDCERLLEAFEAGQWELSEDGVVHTVNMIYTECTSHISSAGTVESGHRFGPGQIKAGFSFRVEGVMIGNVTPFNGRGCVCLLAVLHHAAGYPVVSLVSPLCVWGVS